MKYTKRALALFLALCMMVTSAPVTTDAAETVQPVVTAEETALDSEEVVESEEEVVVSETEDTGLNDENKIADESESKEDTTTDEEESSDSQSTESEEANAESGDAELKETVEEEVISNDAVMLTSELDEEIDAQAASGTTYVLAGGDFQEAGDHTASAKNVTDILNTIYGAGYTTMNGFLFIGDYDCETHNDATETANGITALMGAVQGRYSNINDANSVLVQGNHDYMDSRIDATGGHDFDGYSAFVLNEDDYVNEGGSESDVQALATELETWLNGKIAAGDADPIFITSHLPLAFGPRTNVQGDAKYAKYLFDVLNAGGQAGLNIIFIHGHDHAYGYDNYLGGEAIYLPKGDEINIAKVGSRSEYTTETLAFTYMNAGYVGYYDENGYSTNDAGTDKLTMTVFAITEDEVTVGRYSANGEYNLKSAGRLTGDYINNVNVTANEDVYSTTQKIELTTPVQYTVTDEVTGVTVTSQYAEAELGLSVTAGVTVDALADTEAYAAYEAYTISTEADVSGNPAIITIPVPTTYPLDGTIVYLVSSAGTLTEVDADITMVAGEKVAVFLATEPGTYAVAVTRGDTTETPVAPAATIGSWVTVSETSGGDGNYKYTLDTDGVDAGEGYLIVGSDDAYTMINNGTSLSAAGVTISGSTATINNATCEWTITSDNKITNGTYYLKFTGSGGWFSPSADVGLVTSSGEATSWDIVSNGDGTYSISYSFRYTTILGSDTATGYLYYDSNVFDVTIDNPSTVRLYGDRIDPVVTSETTLAIAEGDPMYIVSMTATADQALAKVEAGITVYTSTDNGATKTEVEDANVTWTWIDTFNSGTEGFYTVEISYEGKSLGTVEVQVMDTHEGINNGWVDVSSKEYTYTLDTDGINYGENNKYLIVGYYSDGTDDDFAITADGSNTGIVDVTISGNTATVDSRDYEWYFARGLVDTDSNNYNTFITQDGETWLYHTNSNMYVGNGADAHRGYWRVDAGSSRNGLYKFYDRDNSDWYLRYSSSGEKFTVRTDTDTYVRLYRYTGERVIKTEYAMIEGQTLYNVAAGTMTEAQILAMIQKGITGYIADDASGTNKAELTDGELTWTWVDEINPNAQGYYTMSISYNGKELGTVEVFVEKKAVSYYSVEPTVGYVSQNASQQVAVKDADGNPIYVTTHYTDGLTSTTPLTVGMLLANGEFVDTSNAGTRTGLTVTYNGYEINNNFTLHILERVVNNYPEYPDEGAVKVNKTATGIDFQSSGIAQVELSASGVPVKKGADVIIMLDTSSSMTNHTVTGTNKTRAAVLEESLEDLIEQFKTPGDDGELLDIRVAIADFNGFYGENQGTSGTSYDRDAADMMSDDISYNAVSEARVYTGNGTLSAGAFVDAADLLDTYTLNYTSGTNYDYAFDAIYQMGAAIQAQNADNDEERDLFVIFMSDGAAMQWNYYHSQGASSLWNNWITGTWTADDLTTGNLNCTTHAYYYNTVDTDGDGMINEHRMANAIKGAVDESFEVIRKTSGLGTAVEEKENMYTVPGLGATMFSISFDATADDQVTEESMDKSIETLASEQTGSTQYYYKVTSADELANAFTSIGNEIAYAATKAYFVDNMGSAFNVQLAPKTYITVVDDEEVEKTVTPEMIVQAYDIYTRADYLAGRITEDKIGTRKGTSTILEKVTFNDDGTAAYSNQIGNGATNILNNGVIEAKTFWYNTTDTTVRIDTDGNGTADFDLNKESFYWKLGTIATTELALSYYVYLTGTDEGTREAGAYATNASAILYYDNYLGNACEKPTVSPVVAWESANVSYAFYLVNEDGEIIVNQTSGETGSFANRIAITSPVVYDEILLNNTDDVRSISVASLGLLSDEYELYDAEAVYNIEINANSTGGWTILKGDGKVNSTYVTEFASGDAFSNTLVEDDLSYDYTHTVVWFAVVSKLQTISDTVVIDFGLPVDISVLVNDMFGDYGKLAAVGPIDTIPTVEQENGTETRVKYTEVLAEQFGETCTAKYGKAQLLKDANNEITGKVRYTPNTTAMNDKDTLAYAVNYTGVVGQGYYYGDITVIPATTVYYEDNFVTFAGKTRPDANSEYVANNEVWQPVGTYGDATQAEDRPGEYSLSDIDRNNLYGFDQAYDNANMSTYSMGSAMKAHIVPNTIGTASFSFWGTGFDVIGLTSSQTGVLVVQIYDHDTSKLLKSYIVDTYYGYKYENGEWIVDTTGTTDNALYQIPVMKIEEIDSNGDGMADYGHYDVKITASYSGSFDHTTEDGYDLYIDAVRIYNPAGNDNEVITNVYKQDGEGWPSYYELRNEIIEANTFGSATVDTATITGAVFIDGKNDSDATVSDYTNYGPNNELYLAAGQSVVFDLNLPAPELIADVQLGVKSANGIAANCIIHNVGLDADNKPYAFNNIAKLMNSSTDMYYTIYNQRNNTIVITNDSDGDGIISLTNIKITYTEDPQATSANSLFSVTPRNVGYALRVMNYESFVPETFEVAANAETVEVGENAEFTVTTSSDVEYIYANDVMITEYAEAGTTGNRTWTVSIATTKVGEVTVDVAAYNADGTATETTVNAAVTVVEKSFTPEIFKVSVDGKNVKAGDRVKVTVTTSSDVEAIAVNGETVFRYKENKRKEIRTWTVTLKAEEAGEMVIETVAYDVEGTASNALTNTIIVKEARKNIVEEIFHGIFEMLFGKRGNE